MKNTEQHRGGQNVEILYNNCVCVSYHNPTPSDTSTNASDTICSDPLGINPIRFVLKLTPKEASYQGWLYDDFFHFSFPKSRPLFVMGYNEAVGKRRLKSGAI